MSLGTDESGLRPTLSQEYFRRSNAEIELSERKDHFPGRPEFPPVIEFPSSRTAVFYCNSPYTRSYSIYLLPGDSPFRLPAAGEPAPFLPRNRNRKRKCRLHSPGNTSIVENGRTMHRVLLLIHNIDMQQSAGYALSLIHI